MKRVQFVTSISLDFFPIIIFGASAFCFFCFIYLFFFARGGECKKYDEGAVCDLNKIEFFPPLYLVF